MNVGMNNGAARPELTAKIFDIAHASFVDGPGIRTTVFFQGCALRCAWCHNPESQCFESRRLFYTELCRHCGRCASVCPSPGHCTLCGRCEAVCPHDAVRVVGKVLTLDAVFDEIMADRAFYTAGGGMTCSGGECMLQLPFLKALLRSCKKEQIHTAVDTAGDLPFSDFEEILPFTDLFLYDIKCMDAETHRKYTGADNRRILDNYAKLADGGSRLLVRIPLVAGVNDSPDEAVRIAAFLRAHPLPERVELLPYHSMGARKYKALGKPLPVFSAPSAERIREILNIFLQSGIDCIVNG